MFRPEFLSLTQEYSLEYNPIVDYLVNMIYFSEKTGLFITSLVFNLLMAVILGSIAYLMWTEGWEFLTGFGLASLLFNLAYRIQHGDWWDFTEQQPRQPDRNTQTR